MRRSGVFRASLGTMLAAALLATGCTVPQPQPQPTPRPTEQPEQKEPPVAEEARKALSEDRPLEAAALFETAAGRTESPLRDQYLLQAAQIYARGGDAKAAENLLGDIDPEALSKPRSHRLTLVRVRIHLIDNRPQEAAQLLETLPPQLDGELEMDRQLLRLQTLEGRGRYLEAARQRSELTSTLEQPAQRQRNFQQIWRNLTRLPQPELQTAMPAESRDFHAWLELAELFHTHRLAFSALEEGIRQWQRRYMDHPASSYVDELVEAHKELLRPPQDIALMLPLSGRLSAVGEAIKHGFMAAYYEDTDQRPRVQLFDVGEQGKDVVSAYRDAVEAGMDLVVGPLTKQSLEALSVWDSFPVPVLALNTINGSDLPTDRFYQFGLAPEDDARAAAHLMASEGHRRAVVLVPNTEWGDRVADAFRKRFEGDGNTVLQQAYYAPEASDFGDTLTRLFNLDASRARFNALQGTVSAEMEFEPRRRHDMDALFFAADPQQARLIRPQVRFHHGIGLPVYATSHAHTSDAAPNDDQDMDKLRIVEIPWLLGRVEGLPQSLQPEAVGTLWPDERHGLGRLIAMGIDAYRLAPVVDVLRAYPSERIIGATGEIFVDGNGRVHRLLPAAAFEQGKLVPLDLDKAPFGEPVEFEPIGTGPIGTGSAQTEPTQTEPAQTEPARTEPARTEPAQTEPARTEPAQTEPAQTEPARTEPARTEPARTEPARTEPARTEPLQ